MAARSVPREANGALCETGCLSRVSAPRVQQQRAPRILRSRIRTISAFELHTNSFYAMNAAIQKFQAHCPSEAYRVMNSGIERPGWN